MKYTGMPFGNLIQAVEIPVQCCIAAMRTQNNIIFHRINAFVFCTKILIGT